MDDQILEKAVEDVQLIRNVMDRSTDSLYLMYRLFIWWGAAYAVIGAAANLLCLLWRGLSNAIYNAPFLAFTPHLATAISVTVIFLLFRKGLQEEGLNRQFMLLWLAILSYGVISQILRILWLCYYDKDILMHTNLYFYFIPGISVTMTTLGMFCMYLFTRAKPFGRLALAYLLVDIAFYIIPYTYTVTIAGTLLYSLVSPLTLMAAGILLRTGLQKKAMPSLQ